MLLIAISILTTYQHHFIDLPTGLAVGLIASVLDVSDFHIAHDPLRWRIATLYAIGALLFAAIASIGGGFLWLFWPAIALILIACNYAFIGARGFQKQTDGRLTASAIALFAPTIAGAWINSRLWTRRCAMPNEVVDGVFIGRIPLQRASFDAVVDLCAELPCRASAKFYRSIPVLDHIVATDDELRSAAAAIEEARTHGRVLVCCALGFSRSASAVIAWLLMTRRAESLEAAMEMVRRARPAMVLRNPHRAALEALA